MSDTRCCSPEGPILMMDTATKVCINCCERLGLAAFHKRSKSRDGL
jgi:hypothetical protein